MITEHLEFLLLDEDLSLIPPPSKKPRTKKAEPPPEPEPAPEPEKEEEEVEETPPAVKHALSRSGPPKSYHSWGVKDRAGEWITIPGDPNVAPMDCRSVPHVACNITRPEALAAFENLPDAFQLIDGCDWWACLSDEDEVLVVVKEKTDVPAPKTVLGAGASADGPGSDETPSHSSTEDTPG